MEPEAKKKCSDILDYFINLETTGPFRERVNWEEWGLYDYLQVVKVPMDLGTIRMKLSKGEYTKTADFLKDMRLVWDNCKLYNQDGSDLYILAEELGRKFEDRAKMMRLAGGQSRLDKTYAPPTVEERIVLSQNIYKVANKDLETIVNMLEEQCPRALDRSSPDEVDIIIDSIEPKIFRTIEKLISETVSQESQQTVANLLSRNAKKTKDTTNNQR
uniref:Uncharacterized protein AlNc14C5G706 n=1 Tax=Albugo laibachii Nc14 TaxID=890382 RepID=F0W0S1_9STRA|nr:conserved hypothetical protein [Albugo laibachii Nc14]|eukprot:CCA14645.1 conserved hypothetical protein [Albugo laibachii Nc14]